MRTFTEYLDDKKKLVLKPKVEKVPDYEGPKPTKPDAPATSGDNWKTEVKPKGSPAPYKAAGTDPGQQKPEKNGFADMGDKDLVYEPDTWNPEKVGEGGKKVASWPKTKTEVFLQKTESLSLPAFTKYISRQINEHCGCENKKAPHVVAYSVGAFHPDPIQAINYVTYLANENKNLLHALVMEAKRVGCLKKIVSELLSFPETYKTLAEAMGGKEGNIISGKLVRAMNEQSRRLYGEEIAPPVHFDDEEEEEEEKIDNGEDAPHDNIEGEEDSTEDLPLPEDEPVDDEEEPKKPAHDNLLSAMKGHENMFSSMRKMMGYR